MFRQAIQSLLQVFDLRHDIPPLPRRTLVPGLLLLMAYPLLAVLLGPGEEGQAFVTAFLLALAVRIAVRFDDFVSHISATFSRRETALAAVIVVFTPLAMIASVDDPIWCQRLQSLYYVILGSFFVSDMMAGRADMAQRFWPWAEMRPHLQVMTRAMVLFYLALLVLNETTMRALDPSHWLIYWAVLPVLSHVALSLLILTIVNTDDGPGA